MLEGVTLDELLRFMTKKGASDLHLKPTRPPLVRLQGKLIPIKAAALTPQEIEQMVLPLLNDFQKRKFAETQSVDLGYGVPGLARFRCNIYHQRGSVAAVFRRVPFDIRDYGDLSLPQVVASFSSVPAGLVLITGPTGSGKSTTLAAILKDIVHTRQCHIVTIEDPIEFLFADHLATISQREVGTDTPTFREALRNAVRQDPDVIMVGEMRDLETVATVLTAAETGHLVFSTLHTNSASQTVDRIIDAFPADQQVQVRSQLSQVLRGVISMQLVVRADGEGRVPAVEVLVNSPKISRHIELGEIKSIHDEIENSVAYYRMQSMNQSLVALVAHGVISYDTACQVSPDSEDFSLKLRKLFPQIEDAQREGKVKVSPADFANIVELMEVKRLYEEQEEHWKRRMEEKESVTAQLQAQVTATQQELASARGATLELQNQIEAVRAERERAVHEANVRIEKLNERIRDLNQQLAVAAHPAPEKPEGFFKR